MGHGPEPGFRRLSGDSCHALSSVSHLGKGQREFLLQEEDSVVSALIHLHKENEPTQESPIYCVVSVTDATSLQLSHTYTHTPACPSPISELCHPYCFRPDTWFYCHVVLRGGGITYYSS